MGRPIDQEKLNLEFPDTDRLYVTVGKFDVRIVHTDEGVVVDIFPHETEDKPGGNSLASTYAFDSDADEDES